MVVQTENQLKINNCKKLHFLSKLTENFKLNLIVEDLFETFITIMVLGGRVKTALRGEESAHREEDAGGDASDSGAEQNEQ